MEGSKDKNLCFILGLPNIQCLKYCVIMREIEERTRGSVKIVQSAPNDRTQAIFSTRR